MKGSLIVVLLLLAGLTNAREYVITSPDKNVELTAESELKVWLAPGGGNAIRIVPQD